MSVATTCCGKGVKKTLKPTTEFEPPDFDDPPQKSHEKSPPIE
jgi:hypothetical protein